MKFDAVTINVGTAGTRVQVSNTTQKVRWIKFSAKTGNSGITYVGISDVAAANGYELSANDSLEFDFGKYGGSEVLNVFYVDAATNNDKVDVAMILDG
tara:strand:+ start:281 stop:574 length:294 start_codon:yes stop_codon:yes gene_type:complete